MTTAPLACGRTVYRPQDDTALLIEALNDLDLTGRRVLDLCTGSGAIAAAAAERGAAEVVAVDSCPEAVAAAARLRPRDQRWTAVRSTVDTFADAARFDLVTCNPPYVPSPAGGPAVLIGDDPAAAWDGGPDGRSVLDPLCQRARELLRPGGALLVVQSEVSSPEKTRNLLQANGFDVVEVRRQTIKFGPVMCAQRDWLVDAGYLSPAALRETLVVLLARMPVGP